MTAQNEAKELIKVIRPCAVKYLYKYRSMASVGLEELFCQRKIYLNDATKFNDPFECRPALTHHQSSFKREMLLKEMTKHRFPNADKKTVKKLMKGKGYLLTDPITLARAYEGFVNKVGIYCLSEKNDDLLMWSHYSNSHRGLCLQFDASTEITIFWEAFKVIYQEDYPVVNIMDMGKAEEFRKALLTKSTHWEYEQERRILKMEEEGGPGYYRFAPELLKGVILGARMAVEDRQTLLHWIDKYPTRVSIYQSALNGCRYKLDITEITEA
jgi:hypothetical protein